MPKRTKAVMYDNDSKMVFYFLCSRVDITDNESIFYLYDNIEVAHLPWYMKSFNIERGIITAYYANGSYVILTND
jgi:hypothetical protein